MSNQKKSPMCTQLESEKQHVHRTNPSDALPSIDLRLLPIREVQQIVGLSRASIYALMKTGNFPVCLKVSRASRWISTEIEAWIASLERGTQA
jgi:prophage regulatory protein